MATRSITGIQGVFSGGEGYLVYLIGEIGTGRKMELFAVLAADIILKGDRGRTGGAGYSLGAGGIRL